MKLYLSIAFSTFVTLTPYVQAQSQWLLVDNFESNTLTWTKADTQNDTNPHIENPQITEIRIADNNHFLIKKPAADEIIGNRKALSFLKLPKTVEVDEVATFYTRINVESFPNNHAFGLSNLDPEQIMQHGYDAFEATLRVTDKAESNGFKNDGALMVKTDNGYSNIQNYANQQSAQALQPGKWYEIWYVVNNAKIADGGQHYDVYVQGGEFAEQNLVYKNATFRMKREQPLTYFLANCNTGPLKQPYGNGGLMYDDLYMSQGKNLSLPMQSFK